MRLFGSAFLLACLASTLGAQTGHVDPAGVIRAQRDTPARLTTAADSHHVPSVVPRLLLGTAGAAGGLVAGAYLGVAIFGRDCGGCDDPGLGQAVTGATVGSVLGAAALSAIPALGSHCRYAGRFGRALLGSSLGALLGVVASGGTELVIVTFPLGVGAGAGLASNTC